jgi:hypothetical protein
MSNDAARSRDQRVGTPAPHQGSAIDPFMDLLGSLGLSVRVWVTKVCYFRDWDGFRLRHFGLFMLYNTRILSICE